MSDLSQYGLRTRTEIAYKERETAVHEHVLLITEIGHASADQIIWGARQLTLLAKQKQIMAVLMARLVYDTPWAEVAVLLNLDETTARRLYEDAERRWVAGDVTPWLPRVRDGAASRPLLRRLFGGSG